MVNSQKVKRIRKPSRQRYLRAFEALEERIVLSASPWQNPVNALDVNRDSYVTPLDVLIPINELNDGTTGELRDDYAPPILQNMAEDYTAAYLDPNGDGMLSPVDALAIINVLNGGFYESLPEAEMADQHGDAPGDMATHLDMDYGYAFVESSLNTSHDVDAYEISVEDGRLAIEAYNYEIAGGMLVELLNYEEEVIASFDVGDMDEWSESGIDIPVEDGSTYYVMVSAEDPESIGEYVLDVYQYDDDWYEFGTDSELGDDIHADEIGEDATELVFEWEYATVTSHIDDGDDIDVFKLAVTDGQMTFSVYPEDASSLMRITVSDANAETIAMLQGDEYGAWGEIAVDEGEYFISLSSLSGNADQYTVDVSHYEEFSWMPEADAELGDDIHADEIGESATELEFEWGFATRISNVDRVEDVDIFRFTATSDIAMVGAYASDWEFDSMPEVNLFDANGEEVPLTSYDDAMDVVFEKIDEELDLSEENELLIDEFMQEYEPEIAVCWAFPGEVYELTEGDDYFVSVGAGVQEFTGQYTLDVTTFDDDIFWW